MPAIALELGDVAAFLFLLLIAAALWVLIRLLDNSLGRLPVVGGWITSNIGGALNDARNAILTAAGDTWTAGAKLFRWAQAIIANISGALFDGFTQALVFAQRIYGVTLPNLENRVLVTTSGWVSSAEGVARQLWSQAVTYADQRVSALYAVTSGWVASLRAEAAAAWQSALVRADQLFTAAESDAARLVAQASATLTADLHAVESFAASGITAAETLIRADVAALERDLAAGITAAESLAAVRLAAVQAGIYTDLDAWGRQAVADAWPDAAQDIAGLRRTLGADFPWLSDLAPALAGAGAAGLAGVLIQSVAGAHAITRLADECIVPNCRNLSGLGHDLSDLLAAGSTAAMLAWLIFGVTDPAGWAGETARAAGPVAAGLADDAARLLGVSR